MNIYWKNKRVKNLVEGYANDSKKVAKTMIKIKASVNFYDLPGNVHFLKGNLKNRFAIDLIGRNSGKRLICKPNGNCKKDENDNYVKKTITEIMILEFTDHYKK